MESFLGGGGGGVGGWVGFCFYFSLVSLMFVIIFGFCFVGGRDVKLGREDMGGVGGKG